MRPLALVLLALLAPAEDVGQVAVDVVVEDADGRPIRDISKSEVVVFQDRARQTVLSFAYSAARGCYELRYEPTSGRVGAVSVQVTRGGARLRGLDGPQVTPRWIAPILDFERPLRAALYEPAAPAAPAGLACETAVLRFEARGDTLHHSFLAEIPFSAIAFERKGERQHAHLAFLLRVKAEDGLVVHEGSLDQPLDAEAGGPGAIEERRFVWSSHVHLRRGRYLSELVVMDQRASRLVVHRAPLVVEPWPAGLRVGSLAFLFGLGGLMGGDDMDNPLRLEDQALVPMVRPRWVAGSEGALSLLAMLYPDRGSTEPVAASIELHRDGALRAQAPVPLPRAVADGAIRYVGSLKFSALQPGSYVVKLVARQGSARVEESAVLEVVNPPSP